MVPVGAPTVAGGAASEPDRNVKGRMASSDVAPGTHRHGTPKTLRTTGRQRANRRGTSMNAEKGPAIKGSDAGPRNACTGIEPAQAPAQGGKRETPSVHPWDPAAMHEFH